MREGEFSNRRRRISGDSERELTATPMLQFRTRTRLLIVLRSWEVGALIAPETLLIGGSTFPRDTRHDHFFSRGVGYL